MSPGGKQPNSKRMERQKEEETKDRPQIDTRKVANGEEKKGTLQVIIVVRRQSLIPSLITTWTFYIVDYVQFTNQSKTI